MAGNLWVRSQLPRLHINRVRINRVPLYLIFLHSNKPILNTEEMLELREPLFHITLQNIINKSGTNSLQRDRPCFSYFLYSLKYNSVSLDATFRHPFSLLLSLKNGERITFTLFLISRYPFPRNPSEN